VKKKLLIILGGGGHTAQMIRLIEVLGDQYIYFYVVNNTDNISYKKIRISGKIFKISLAKRFKGTFFDTVIKTLKAFFDSFYIINKARCDAIISAGPGISVPLFIVAKLFRMKTIYIESWSRVMTKSDSGKICYRFSDLFFVQWPEMKKLYPKAIYAGRVG
jgi:UDP-N-acetylglucosamine:LPS N-acetylglucosamine transferase